MVSEFESISIATVPNDLLALCVCWKDVVVAPYARKHLSGHMIDAELVFPPPTVCHHDSAFVAFVESLKNGELIVSRSVVVG